MSNQILSFFLGNVFLGGIVLNHMQTLYSSSKRRASALQWLQQTPQLASQMGSTQWMMDDVHVPALLGWNPNWSRVRLQSKGT